MTVGAIHFDPIVPVGFIAMATALLLAITVYNYSRPAGAASPGRRGLLFAMRAVVILAVATILMRPMGDAAHTEAGTHETFVVLVDTSESMDTEDAGGEKRLVAAIAALKNHETLFQGRMQRSHAVQFQAFGAGMRSVSYNQLLAHDLTLDDSTDLASALGWLGAEGVGREIRGALLLSDGRDNAGGGVLGAAQYLKTRGIPVWTTTIGEASEAKDLKLTARFDQNFVFQGQEATLLALISQTGYHGWYVKVELFREGELLTTTQVMLDKGALEVPFPVREDDRGTVRYAVRAVPLKGEVDESNNERTAFLQVAGEKAKILFIEAEPYWDSKFLLRALQADPNLDVTAIFNMSPTRNKMFAVTQDAEGGSVRLPRTEDELFAYDCVILGRGAEDLFDAEGMALLKRYVEQRGGGLVFARGKAYEDRESVLKDLEPLIWDDGVVARARFELTPMGDTNPIFDFGVGRERDYVIRELPEMLSITRVRDAKSIAVVLAKTEDDANGAELATIAYQRYGKGKVMTIGATGLWRWAFMRKELSHYDEIYARFWGQLLRWIVYGSDFLPGQDISFQVDRHEYEFGSSVSFVVQTKLVDAAAYNPSITLTGPEETHLELQPVVDEGDGHVYTATFIPEHEGEYEAVLHNNVGAPETDTVRFAVYSNAVETRMVSADPALMKQIAETTGARPLEIGEWPDLASEMQTRKLSSRVSSKPVDAWDRGPLFAAIVTLLVLEWFMRRRAGMI